MPRHHGEGSLRGLNHVPCSSFSPRERFGRLFPSLPAARATEEQLENLASSMPEGDNAPRNSPTIPAGFVFFGQFVDHDVTLDTTSSLERQNDPAAIRNFRTPLLELDSVYGQGPEGSPFLYDQRPGHEGELLTGTDDNERDLPRNRQGRALTGDPRNDENGIISQLHLAFLRFHNAVLARVKSGELDCRRSFENDFLEAQQLVRWHYQWIVRNEYLPLIVDGDVLESIEEDGFQVFQPDFEPFMPVEFAVAAFRFGHSQVRRRYALNANRTDVQLFKPPADALTSFEPVPSQNVIEWPRFFKMAAADPQPARQIDGRLSLELFQLPFAAPGRDQNLAFRNLLRGLRLALPSGESVACALGLDPIPREQLGIGQDALVDTPLWFYILKEAELNDEDKLGPVGGRIVAETLLGMLHGDPMSHVMAAPCWKPCLPAAEAGAFTMADLLRLADEAP